MKRCFMVMAAAALLAAGGTQLSFGFGGGGMGGMGGPGGGMGGGRGGRGARPQEQSARRAAIVPTDNLRELLTFAKELELTDEQKESIRLTRGAMLKTASDLQQQLSAEYAEAAKLLDGDTPDFAGARAKFKKMADGIVTVQLLQVDSYEKAYALLSKAQQQKLTELRKKLKEARTQEEGAPGNGQMPPEAEGGPGAAPDR